jgi:CubicO group peptidase (beta-lactamase class C family)
MMDSTNRWRWRWLLVAFVISSVIPIACQPSAGASGASSPPSYAAAELPFLEGLANADRFSGAVLVAKAGRPVLRQAFGMADWSARVVNRPETRFRIGSITKTLTATAVMILIQEERLQLADSPCLYVAGCPDPWHTVTIRNLLTHTSGIPDYLAPISLAQFNSPMPPRAILDLVRGSPLQFAPGTKYQYSNSNYLMLGLVIEGVSGTSYGAFLQERIFKPLGMLGSGYSRDFSVVPHHATGYGYKTASRSETIPTDEAAFSDGGLYSTVDDLLRFDQALYGSELLSTATTDEMFTPWGGGDLHPSGAQVTGLGWNLGEDPHGARVVFHGGQIPGFNALFSRDIGPRVTVIILSNYYWAPVDTVASALYSRALS